ncbi:MAG: 16S rRNA (cytidine(1402)-2'-O)-methyltransferase [Anaerotruncus sp.]|nr:MAG: 16S rRNA (cytidine(1402)-2'-O)-methyltransferase [Anaerotruncus sp.]
MKCLKFTVLMPMGMINERKNYMLSARRSEIFPTFRRVPCKLLPMWIFIAAEDTRVTLKILNRFGIKKEAVSYYEHNKREKGELICARIAAGENCAIVTDAGMPAISDPGQELVEQCHERGIQVVSVPGPTAFATALAISGMDTGRFTFEGFLSVSKKSRFEHLDEIKDERRTMVFYEAPHKLVNTLRDLYAALGNRKKSQSCEKSQKNSRRGYQNHA